MSRRFLILALVALLLPLALVAQTPVLTVSPETLDWDSATPVRATISGLTGTATNLRLYVNIDGDGIIDAEDYLIWDYVGHDNVPESSPIMFSDQNPLLGTIALDLGAIAPFRFPHTAGNFLFVAQDVSSALLSNVVPFTVTQVSGFMTVSGQVLDEVGAAVPGALVVLVPLGSNGFGGFGEDWERWGPSCISDATGNYTLNVPASFQEAGSCTQRLVLPIKPGFMTQMLLLPDQPLITLGASVAGQNPVLRSAAGGSTVTGTVTYGATAQGIPGAMVFAISDDGPPEFTVAVTEVDGTYAMPITAHAFSGSGNFFLNCWDPMNLAFQGAVGVDNDGAMVTVPTMPGSLTADLAFEKASGFIRGALSGPVGTVVGPGLLVHAKDLGCYGPTPTTCYRTNGLTNSSGQFVLGVVGGTGTYQAVFLNRAYIPQGLLSVGATCTFVPAAAWPVYVTQNISLQAPTATVSGQVRDLGGNALGGLSLHGTYYPSSCQMVNSRAFTACGDGSYSLPATSGSSVIWTVELAAGELNGAYRGIDDEMVTKQVRVPGNVSGADLLLGGWPIAPHLTEISPAAGYDGGRVLLHGTGFSMGSTPRVTWTDPTGAFPPYTAAVLAFYPDLGDLYVTSPPWAAPLYARFEVVVTNEDLGLDSAPLCYTYLGAAPGSCTLTGTVSTSGGPLQGAVIKVSDSSRAMRGLGFSDAIGNYSITLPEAATDYRVAVYPPPSMTQSTYLDYTPGFYTGVTCSGARDHLFSAGSVVQGRVADSNGDGIEFAQVDVVTSAGVGIRTLADMNGNFGLRVPPGTGNTVRFMGPPTSRYISAVLTGQSYPDPGGPYTGVNATLLAGAVLAGNVHEYGLENEADLSSPKGFMKGAPRVVEAYRTSDGVFAGRANMNRAETCDGLFAIVVPENTTVRLQMGDPDPAKAVTRVNDFTLTWDTFAEFPFPVYDQKGPTTPEPRFGRDLKSHGQLGEPVDIWGENFDGGETPWFKIASGDYIGGVPTVDVDRGILATRVPDTASLTYLDVDHDVGGLFYVSQSFPFAVDAGTFDPGSLVVSGTVTGDGVPQEGVLVALMGEGHPNAGGCDDHPKHLNDFVVTGAAGTFSLNAPPGDIALVVFPPAATGRAAAYYFQAGLSANLVHDFALEAPAAVTVTVRDQSSNLVEGARVSFMGANPGFIDTRVTDASGVAVIPLPNGTYEVEVLGPEKDRFYDYMGTYTAPGTGTLNVMLTRGVLATARVVDPAGDPVARCESQTQNPTNYDIEYDFGFTREEGWASMRVPSGQPFNLGFRPQEDSLGELWETLAAISYDTVRHPSLFLPATGILAGTVTENGTGTPLSGINVRIFPQAFPGNTVTSMQTCTDGSYRFKLSEGTYAVGFNEDLGGGNDTTHATEYFNEVFCAEASTTRAIIQGANVSADDALDLVGVVHGSVYEAAGNTPVPGATVAADGVVLGPCGPYEVTSDVVDGTYQMTLPVGSFTFSADTSGTYPTQWWDHVGSVTLATSVAVTGGSSSLVEFDLGSVPAEVPPTSLKLSKTRTEGEVALTFALLTGSATSYNLYMWNNLTLSGNPQGVNGDTICHMVPGVTPGFVVDAGGLTATYTFSPDPAAQAFLVSGSNAVGEGTLGYSTDGERDNPPSPWRCGDD